MDGREIPASLSKQHPGTVRVKPYIDKQNGDYSQLKKYGNDINQFDGHSAGGKYYVLFDKAYKEQIEALVAQGMEKEEAK
jgi:hypothetical protein